MKMIKMTYIITQMKKIQISINSSLDVVEDYISEFKDTVLKIIKIESYRENKD